MRLIAGLFLFVANISFGYEVALTFDDLPGPGQAKIQEVLLRNGVPATGFVNGSLVYNKSKILSLKRWEEAGLALENHSFAHKDAGHNPVADILEDIKKNHDFLVKNFKNTPKYYRFPFLSEGKTEADRAAILKFLGENGYRVAPVTIDFEDWAFNNTLCFAETALARTKASRRIADILFGRDIKHIMLLHGSENTAMALEGLVAALRADGAQFISLENAMSDEVYNIDHGFTADYGMSFLLQLVQTRGISYSRINYPQIDRGNTNALCETGK
jgi:peptidoglycan/xylan/chitin deacetylase (PgdA/CDA1 family)